MSLTIDEIRVARDKLQSDILKLIQDFEKSSTVTVEDIRLEKGIYFTVDEKTKSLRTDTVLIEVNPAL